MNFLQKFRDFISHPTHSRTMGLIVMLILVAAVSLTVIVAQQQQQIRQRAALISDDACSTIDVIPTCASSTHSNVDCETGKKEGNKCKIDGIIYECQRQQVGESGGR